MQQKKTPLPDSLLKIKKELKKKMKSPNVISDLTAEEQALIEKIKGITSFLNKNNVTRTKAYLDFYHRFPEIHWAFLGHMVSRNGGWNMTDLKGSFLSRLMTKREASAFFTFLERGNWLIFQDAFPQFLLYEESQKCGKNLFHLLPHFHISTFMEVIWNHFLQEKDPYTLMMALVINEQNYLEERVLKNPAFIKNVFNTFEFVLQEFLSMNHILFPFTEKGKIKLVGQTLDHFQSLHERILLGKRLYAVLCRDQERFIAVKKWADENPHTGSRKDYWPHLFNDVNEGVPGTLLKPSIRSCQLTKGSSKIYSPMLAFAWKNRIHEPAEIGDWFNDWKVVYYLAEDNENVDGEIKNDYCKTLERLELAATTKKTISLRDA
ncbi:DUF2515 domain-containing protein [Cytobacillus depressus]|uniref:DUF2515 domain-containing protein n=2 Tax=Cytobacillus depressus TaxID=1602942 RepID=A0A6L3UZV8_9BACI|nr:DUF2515 domain-containing protein [Cytobacillus depressus]